MEKSAWGLLLHLVVSLEEDNFQVGYDSSKESLHQPAVQTEVNRTSRSGRISAWRVRNVPPSLLELVEPLVWVDC